MEKPFGTSVATAEALNRLVTRLVPENQIYRVDHYLGMHGVQNIIGLRFANRLIEPLLGSTHVQRIEIISEEPLGVEGRAGYYDRAGALVDVAQSHLLQVLALVAMEPPARLDARDLRDGKAQVLRATHVWNDDPVKWSRRARYTAGAVDGRQLPSYVEEDGVDPARCTETFAEIVLEVAAIASCRCERISRSAARAPRRATSCTRCSRTCARIRRIRSRGSRSRPASPKQRSRSSPRPDSCRSCRTEPSRSARCTCENGSRCPVCKAEVARRIVRAVDSSRSLSDAKLLDRARASGMGSRHPSSR